MSYRVNTHVAATTQREILATLSLFSPFSSFLPFFWGGRVTRFCYVPQASLELVIGLIPSPE